MPVWSVVSPLDALSRVGAGILFTGWRVSAQMKKAANKKAANLIQKPHLFRRRSGVAARVLLALLSALVALFAGLALLAGVSGALVSGAGLAAGAAAGGLGERQGRAKQQGKRNRE